MFNKDVTHARMRRRIEKPRLVLLDCPLEYKKGESQTNVEITGETDFSKVSKNIYIMLCVHILDFFDVVFEATFRTFSKS